MRRLFPLLLGRIYTRLMDAATLNALIEELESIEKDAGIRQVLQAGTRIVQGAGAKANQMALKGVSKMHRIPGGSTVLNHVLNPGNTPDLAHSFANATKFLGG